MVVPSLSGISGAVGGLMPSTDAIVQDVAASAVAGVVFAGLKTQLGNGALDPLGIFPHGPAVPVNVQQANANNNPNVTVGPTITASAFASLPGPAQASFLAAGGHIVNG